MHPRLKWTLAGLLACAAAALAGVSLARDGAAPGTTPAGLAGSARPAIPQTAAVLQDQDGRRVALRGEGPAVVSFAYTTCEDVCPLQGDQIRGALDQLGPQARRVRVLFVSVDPGQDTPARARRFLLEHRLTGRASFLLGPAPQLQRVWRDYGIQPQSRGREHSAYTVLATDVQRSGFPADRLTPDGLAHDLRRLLAGAG